MSKIINLKEDKFKTLQKVQLYFKQKLAEKFQQLLSLQVGTVEYKNKIEELDESKFVSQVIGEEIQRDFPVELENLKNRKVG